MDFLNFWQIIFLYNFVLIKLICLVLELAKEMKHTINVLPLPNFEASINDVWKNSADGNSREEKRA